MSKFILLIAGFFFFTSCSDAQVENSTENGQQNSINKVISATEFKAKLGEENIQLIDVRTPEEHNAGKIGNASNIDFYSDDFQSQLEKLDKTKPVMLYCASGGRSGKAASMMNSMGFTEVYDLSGGYNGWPY
jgi:rhodanese-related sulfurtransferase